MADSSNHRPERLTTVDALAQTAFVVQGAIERLAAEQGLSIVQTRLLGVLRDRRPTINELARMLGLDKSSVSGLVLRAERRRLVQREPSPLDGRSVLVGLTGLGRALVEQAAGEFERETERLLSPLDAREQATLGDLLSRVLIARAAEGGIDLLDVRTQDASGSAPSG